MSTTETTPFSEDDLLPLSALQHFVLCERRCALHFTERLWQENRFTVEGTLLHERVHAREHESRKDIRIARGVSLRSLRLGLWGKADVVEFHKLAGASQPEPSGSRNSDVGCTLVGARGLWQPFPVEYKRGTAKDSLPYQVQLCAQALCLEEMLNVRIPCGALYLGAKHRRLEIQLDDQLRARTIQAARRLHELIRSGQTPPPTISPNCESCSLAPLCLPTTAKKSAAKYLQQALRAAQECYPAQETQKPNKE